jgi:hypothetical protein
VNGPTGTPATSGPAACQNCAAPLAGPYCARCGQRDERHVHSLGHFIGEAAESLTHADSRLWRTLAALLRPGFLAREFFAGRRARYLPPFRLYLVVSVAFFLLAAAMPAREGGELSGPPDLVLDGPGGCTGLGYDGPGQRWIQPRLQAGCERIARDRGRGLSEAFVHNLPRTLFLFLPLFAAVMLLLYWRPRRYYVEHLLLLVYNHTFAFAIFALLLLARAAWPWPATEGGLTAAALLYMAWYFYRSLLNNYGQSRGRTIAKFSVMGIAYCALGAIMLLLALAYSVVAS